MKKKVLFWGLIGLMLLVAVAAVSAGPIDAVFTCDDYEDDIHGRIELRSDGTFIISLNGESEYGTYEMIGSIAVGESPTLIFHHSDGATSYTYIIWAPGMSKPFIDVNGYEFYRVN